MADEKTIRDNYSGEDLTAIIDCIQTLNRYGVFTLFVEEGKRRITDSFENSEEAVLARQIREMRQDNRVFVTLASLFPPQA